MDKITRLVSSPQGRRPADGMANGRGTAAGTGRTGRGAPAGGGAGGLIGKVSGMLGGRRR
jgi:hypothetical protein